MSDEDVRKLAVGIYYIFWQSGGFSIAAVGATPNGGRWLAPLNWLSPWPDPLAWAGVASVEKIEIGIGAQNATTEV